MSRSTTTFFALALSACGAPSDSADRTTSGSHEMYDSAGVAVILNHDPEWTASDSWHISEVVWDIGDSETEVSEQFTWVPAAAFLSDGSLVLAAQGAAELRYFDPAGRHIRSVGGRGEGPGEFQWLANLWLLGGDSVATYDPGLQRISILDDSGNLVRDYRPLSSSSGRPMVHGVTSSGATILSQSDNAFQATLGSSTGRFRGTDTYLLADSTGSTDTLIAFAGPEMYSAGISMIFSSPVSRGSRAVGGGDRIIVASQERHEFFEYNESGNLVKRIEGAKSPPAVEGELSDIVFEILDGITEDDERWGEVRAVVRSEGLPETGAAFESLLIDSAGNLWVQSFSFGRWLRIIDREPDGPTVWSVYRRDGRWLGDVEVPVGFRLIAVSDDRVAGTWSDDLDVVHVQVRRLQKGTSGTSERGS